MDAVNPIRKELDPALADVLDRSRQQGGFWPCGFGGDDDVFGVLILILVLFAWLIARLLRRFSLEPTARHRVFTIEQTADGIDLIDQYGQRESVPRGSLGLQVASLWQPRRLLILKTWVRGPGRLGRTVALGTVDWVPIKGDATVQEWEEFLGVKVNPQVTMNVS